MKTVDVIIERGSDGTFDANMETYSDLEFGLLGQGKTVEEASQGQLSHYINGVRKPSEKTARKIQERIHEFAKSLSQVRFV